MSSNINLFIKNKIKKKIISDPPTLIFSACDSKHTYFFFLALYIPKQ